jgi:hypothetical protein
MLAQLTEQVGGCGWFYRMEEAGTHIWSVQSFKAVLGYQQRCLVNRSYLVRMVYGLPHRRLAAGRGLAVSQGTSGRDILNHLGP